MTTPRPPHTQNLFPSLSTYISTVTFKSRKYSFLLAVFLCERRRSVHFTLTTKSHTPIKDADFIFENSPVKIIINRNCPEIELAGLKVGPFEEGKEYDVKYWIAHELERAGIARLREEETLDSVILHKISWKEGIQQARQVSPLQEDFYPRLRQYLATLKRGAANNPDKMKEYEKVMHLSHDIVTIRLRKIVALASSPEQTNQTLKDLAKEERILYERLHTIINEWKNKILKVTDET